eukprot:14257465-Alexandrium_andersonii.AAC.1
MKNQISRARHTHGQKPFVFKPGMLVCVWRTGRLGVGVEKQHGPGTNKGRLYGPGTVLGVQTHISSEN